MDEIRNAVKAVLRESARVAEIKDAAEQIRRGARIANVENGYIVTIAIFLYTQASGKTRKDRIFAASKLANKLEQYGAGNTAPLAA